MVLCRFALLRIRSSSLMDEVNNGSNSLDCGWAELRTWLFFGWLCRTATWARHRYYARLEGDLIYFDIAVAWLFVVTFMCLCLLFFLLPESKIVPYKIEKKRIRVPSSPKSSWWVHKSSWWVLQRWLPDIVCRKFNYVDDMGLTTQHQSVARFSDLLNLSTWL